MSEKELNDFIAKKIKHYLEVQNKTQLDLAEYMNVSQATISNWCKGVKIPRMNKIDKIAEFFNIKRSDLMVDKEETNVTPIQLGDSISSPMSSAIKPLNFQRFFLYSYSFAGNLPAITIYFYFYHI